MDFHVDLHDVWVGVGLFIVFVIIVMAGMLTSKDF